MRLRQHRHACITTLASIAGICAGPALLAGCGGSSAPKASTTQQSTQQARATQAQSSADAGSAQPQASHAQRPSGGLRRGRAQISKPTRGHAVQRARQTPATTKDDTPRVNPCTLVSVSEAKAITGGPIASQVEAPLGPTCIYKRGDSQSDITLAVESTNFTRATHGLRKPTRVLVKGRSAYCGKLGPEMLFVPLPDGTVLNVIAPCATAQRFAALALSRLRT